MSDDFGDFDPDDAYDTEPADPEQVAIKLQRLRQQVDPDGGHPSWDELAEPERLKLVAAIVLLLAWLRRQGAFR